MEFKSLASKGLSVMPKIFYKHRRGHQLWLLGLKITHIIINGRHSKIPFHRLPPHRERFLRQPIPSLYLNIQQLKNLRHSRYRNIGLDMGQRYDMESRKFHHIDHVWWSAKVLDSFQCDMVNGQLSIIQLLSLFSAFRHFPFRYLSAFSYPI